MRPRTSHRAGIAALLVLLTTATAAPAGSPKGAGGPTGLWDDVRWGMQPDQVAKILGTRCGPLSKPVNGEVALRNVSMGSARFSTGRLLYAPNGRGLAIIELETPMDPMVWSNALQFLEAKYGDQKVNSHKTGANVQWSRGDTGVRLGFEKGQPLSVNFSRH